MFAYCLINLKYLKIRYTFYDKKSSNYIYIYIPHSLPSQFYIFHDRNLFACRMFHVQVAIEKIRRGSLIKFCDFSKTEMTSFW